MGLGCFPIFDRAMPGFDFDSDGKWLVIELVSLDCIASEIEAMPLSEMFAYDPEGDSDLFEGTEDKSILIDEFQAANDNGPWFEAELGLVTVQKLLAAIRNDSKVAMQLNDCQAAIDELLELERCLKLGRQAKAKFRMEWF